MLGRTPDKHQVSGNPPYNGHMIRFTPVLILLLAGALYLPMKPATVSSQSGEVTGFYHNTTQGFSIRLPEGWVGQENEDTYPLLAIESENRDLPVVAEMWVYDRQGSNSAKTWLDDQILEAGQLTTDRSGSYSVPGADSAYQVLINLLTDDGFALTSLATAVARGSEIFLINVATTEDLWPTVEPQAHAFADSFTLENALPFGVSREDSLFQYWGEIITLDPALSRTGPSDIVGAIFSGLVKLDTDLQVVADIADMWEVSPNGLVYTFTLRDDVRFHDGRGLTARDFKYSWERALDPATESPVALTYLGDIVGAEEMAEGRAASVQGLEVLDARTLQVTIKEPFPYFLGKLTYPTSFAVDRANVESGEDWTEAPNGTGAFKLKLWQKDDLLILERNDDWYAQAPGLANSVYRIFAGRPMQMYENGEIDLAGVYTYNIDRAQDPTNPLNSHLQTGSSLCTTYLGFNVEQPPFDDPNVRQGLALALEIDKTIEVSLQGMHERATGFVPPGIPGHNQALRPTDFDPRYARRLLNTSSYGGAENIPSIKSYSSNDAIHWAWREHLGLDVEEVSVYEYSDWLDRRDNKEFGVFTSGWCADYPDPENFLNLLFHSDNLGNEFNYSNSEVDALLEQAAVEPNPNRRNRTLPAG